MDVGVFTMEPGKKGFGVDKVVTFRAASDRVGDPDPDLRDQGRAQGGGVDPYNLADRPQRRRQHDQGRGAMSEAALKLDAAALNAFLAKAFPEGRRPPSPGGRGRAGRVLLRQASRQPGPAAGRADLGAHPDEHGRLGGLRPDPGPHRRGGDGGDQLADHPLPARRQAGRPPRRGDPARAGSEDRDGRRADLVRIARASRRQGDGRLRDPAASERAHALRNQMV